MKMSIEVKICEQTIHGQENIVDRKDSQGAPYVKLFVVSGVVLCVEQNAGYEKTRQHEKQVNAAPSKSKNCAKYVHRRGMRGVLQAASVVVKENKKDSEAAKAIERWQVFFRVHQQS